VDNLLNVHSTQKLVLSSSASLSFVTLYYVLCTFLLIHMDNSQIWKDSLEIIKVSVSPAIFSTWFSQTYLDSMNTSGEKVVAELGCPTSFAKNTIEARYFGLIQDSLSKVVGKKCDLTFIVKTNPNSQKDTANMPTPLFSSEKDGNYTLEVLQRARIRPSFTFENFAVSSSNQMAHAAAEAVSQNLGNAYNPLFIWGGVGVGKTHLMASVGNYILRIDPDKKVFFCTGEDFTNDIVEGIRNKTTQAFRNKYRKLDLLLIDDIQFIAGKDTVQEEFFHTFNAVTSVGGQVILTSDRPPSEIAKLEERLRSRFEAGLIVDVAPPDFELRSAITQIKAKEKGVDLTSEQAQIIAANSESARKIEGVLTKLLTEIHVKKTIVTNETIESLFSKSL
jgi:chromosomal replication initiator protein